MKLHELLEKIGKDSSKTFTRKEHRRDGVVFGIEHTRGHCIYINAPLQDKKRPLANLNYSDLTASDWELLD